MPENEESRLKSLRSLNILDTNAEERFDRITRIASKLFGVPIALVSLVDEDRQWFKSSVGLSVSETPRDISFCGHAILGDEIFVIKDAEKDLRFKDNPLVQSDPEIRFYAGFPLKTNTGFKLGTMCLIDRHPRTFDQDEIDLLQDLAAIVERELELTQLAIMDELTQIPNRRGFMLLAEQNLSLVRRNNTNATLAFLDLNKFKLINDNFGHAEGDKVLMLFANCLKKASRDSDIVARLSGDEFVMLFSPATKDSVEKVMARVQENLNEINYENSSGYEITFSYGIIEYQPEIHSSVQLLLNDGDELMYENKMT